jgi:sugar phosphate isomerase/epimerase
MMRDLAGHPELCAINTATLGHQAPIEQVIDDVARAGFGGIAPWRREVEGHNVKAIARRIRDAGLTVTGYCRSTYFPSDSKESRAASIAENIRALEDAAILGAKFFALVVGSGKDLNAARAQVHDGIAALLPHAKACGVKLAIEPLHPVYAVDRSCISTLRQALDLCDVLNDPMVGVIVDAYHVWWDFEVERQIKRATGERILAFHVSDWLSPTRDVLNDRGMMGDGVIDLKALRRMVERAGYEGLVECEIFSADNWWKRPMAETLAVVKERLRMV